MSFLLAIIYLLNEARGVLSRNSTSKTQTVFLQYVAMVTVEYSVTSYVDKRGYMNKWGATRDNGYVRKRWQPD